jgi:hypothetical protein
VHFAVPTGPNERLLVPGLSELVSAAAANRRRLNAADVSIAGVPLRELRAGLRRRVLAFCKCDPDDARPIVASGHQPGLPHPGILYKHAVLEQLGHEAVCINVVVESDAAPVVRAKVPTRRGGHLGVAEVVMARAERRVVLARAPKPERRAFEAQLSEVRRTAAKLDSDEILNALDRFAALHREEYPHHDSLATLLTAYRRRYYPTPHVHEVFLSDLCDTDEFRALAAAMIEDAERFLAAHNETLVRYRRERRIRTAVNPFPNLRRDGDRFEVPLWHVDKQGQRSPVYVERGGARATLHAHQTAVGTFASRAQLDRLLAKTCLRPKAATLTTFLRLCAADLFIHGVSGGNYDKATDEIVRAYFGVEPPAYCVASASVRLPLDFDDGLDGRLRDLAYRARRMTWNPDEFVPESNPLRQAKQRLLAAAGERLTREQHEQIEAGRLELLKTIAAKRRETDEELGRARDALATQQQLAARDFPYFLHPLPWLQAAMVEPSTTRAG